MADVKVQKAIKAMSVMMANMYYHLTREMIDTYGEDAKEVITRAMMAFGHERGAKIAEAVINAGEELTIENLDKYYDIPIADGWDLHKEYHTDHKDNITDGCTFADVWIAKNWAEVGHIYCIVDTAIRQGYSKHVKFCPIQNILKGDPVCQSKTIYCDDNRK